MSLYKFQKVQFVIGRAVKVFFMIIALLIFIWLCCLCHGLPPEPIEIVEAWNW